MSELWGIDLGGTKTEIVVMSVSDPVEVHFRHRIPTEAHKGYSYVLSRITTLIEAAIGAGFRRPEKIGIGTPGTLDRSNRVMKGCNTTCLNGEPMLEDLERLLNMEVNLANDANCFALAESKMGVVSHLDVEPEVVFGIIMGTGVGSGIVVNGQILNGHHGIGGEWGHNFLDASGGKCYCGRIGCVETLISGPALERFYKMKSGSDLRLNEIADRAIFDPIANQTINRLLHYFGKAAGNVVNIIDPDVIILGGGVGNIAALRELAPQAIAPYVFQSNFNAPVVAPALGDSAGVFGAALL